MAESNERASAAGDARERLFDEYLEEIGGEKPVDPAAFLARRGIEDDTLLAELESVFRAVREEDHWRPRERKAAAGDAAEQPLPAIAGFRALRVLGHGGMGIVYLAEEEALDRRVALKVVRPEYASSRSAAIRFEREGRVIARLRHPHIVTVYSVGEDRGMRFIAMEYIPGHGLHELLEEGAAAGTPLPVATAVRWAADLARALAYAHSEGIVHRDVKPSNVRITPEGRALLFDFGLARDLMCDAPTLTLSFVGSPHYAAPEQFRSGDNTEPGSEAVANSSNPVTIDGRTDVYGLGALLYHAVTGQAPFSGTTFEHVLHQILVDDPTRPRVLRPDLPRDLEVVIGKAMAKDPAHRYATAAAFADDLEAVLALRPIAARPAGIALRARKWARRNRVATGAIVAASLALVALAAVLVVRSVVDRRARAVDARTALAEAERWIDEHRRAGEVMEGFRAIAMWDGIGTYLPPERERELDERDRELHRARRLRSESYVNAERELERAYNLGAKPDHLRAARLRLLEERILRVGEELREPADLADYRELTGDTEREAAGSSHSMDVTSQPAGAEVFAYRLVELAELTDDGPDRHVPVPIGGASDLPVPLGTWALRIGRETGGFREGDLVLEVAGYGIEGTVLVSRGAGPVECFDRLVSVNGQAVTDRYFIETLGAAETGPGGVPVTKRFELERRRGRPGVDDVERFFVEGTSLEALGLEVIEPDELAERGNVPALVYRNGSTDAVVLPAGLRLRTTAAPVFFTKSAFLGCTPFEGVLIRPAPHRFLTVVRSAGHREWRSVMNEPPKDFAVHLSRIDAAPDGFVHVSLGGAFWMMEREVTLDEYLEFVNDPVTIATIDASDKPVCYPRSRSGPSCPRAPDGTFLIPDGWRGDWPAIGVSWHDAVAYADWKTGMARAVGLDHTYSLPTPAEFRSARGLAPYVYGSFFRPKWFKSCFSRPRPTPEPVLSFPIAESCFGIYDLIGSATEWTDGWNGQGHRNKALYGGSWADGGPAHIFWIELGAPPETVSEMYGFRLTLRIAAGAAATGTGTIRVRAAPAGSAVHLFRFADVEDEDGGTRRVPVPFRAGETIGVAPGTWGLRVVRGAGDLDIGDVIFEVEGQGIRDVWCRALIARAEAGGLAARVWHDGVLEETVLPPGLCLRPTAIPLLCGAASLVGRNVVEETVRAGEYLCVVRLPGHEEVRFPCTVRADALWEATFDLREAGTTPAGFMPIPGAGFIQEREVTMDEYFEFLNDPETLAEIERAGSEELLPRSDRGAYCIRDASGRYPIPERWHADWPVFGVSWHDARAYAGWKTRKARAAGLDHFYDLPLRSEWYWTHTTSTRYHFGDRYRPEWAAIGEDRDELAPTPGMSFPIDETRFGVFDTFGSVAEWRVDADGSRAKRYCFGASWQDRGSTYQWDHEIPLDPGKVSDGIGFRLVLWVGEINEAFRGRD